MKLKSLFASAAVALAAVSATVAHADAVGTFQGVTFTYTIVDSNTFTLRIDGLPNASGNWDPVTNIGALAFEGLGVDVTAATITPAGTFNAGGLASSANGCNGSGASFFCFQFGTNITATNSDLFTIDLTAFTGTLAFTQSTPPHLKVCFTGSATDDACIGSLLSADQVFASSSSSSSTSSSGISSSTSSSSSSGNVPEPNSGSMALLGLGLLAGSFLIRRKSQR